MAGRDTNARVADSWQQEIGPETRLLNYFRALPATSMMGTDRALYDMLLAKESNGTLDVVPPIRSNSARVADSWEAQKQTYQSAKSLNEIKSKYNSQNTAVVPISPGSNVYRVIDTSKYQSPAQRVPGYETQAPTLGYYVVQTPSNNTKTQTTTSTTPIIKPTKTGGGTTKKSDKTTTSVKTTPKPELFYSNDYKELQSLTIDKLLINIVQNSRDLLTSYDYASVDEEDTVVKQSDSDTNSATSYQTTVSRKIPSGIQDDILDISLNNTISQYNDISIRIMNQIFNQIKNYKSLDRYNNYLSIFDGPFYDELGDAYYKLTLNVDPLDGIIVDGSYVITKEEIG